MPESLIYIGLLDHDIFPLNDVSYADIILAQRTYGHFQQSGSYRYYWPGLHFFSTDYYSNKPDFRPHWFRDTYGDTGAGNWRKYYAHLSELSQDSFTIRHVSVDDLTTPFERDGTTSLQESAVTLFDDDWVHLVNGSNWANVDMDAKFAKIQVSLREKWNRQSS